MVLVSTTVAELAFGFSAGDSGTPGTGPQSLPAAGEDHRAKDPHPAAKPDPVPVQSWPSTANASLPTVSRLSTRSEPVEIFAQDWPPSWVAHSSGPKAHPLSRSRNRIWPTPADPSGGPVSGACTPYQDAPVLSVRATDVQYCVAQSPAVPAWPITQPVCRPTKVAEVGSKCAGTGGSAGVLTGLAEVLSGLRTGAVLAL